MKILVIGLSILGSVLGSVSVWASDFTGSYSGTGQRTLNTSQPVACEKVSLAIKQYPKAIQITEITAQCGGKSVQREEFDLYIRDSALYKGEQPVGSITDSELTASVRSGGLFSPMNQLVIRKQPDGSLEVSSKFIQMSGSIDDLEAVLGRNL